MNYDERLIILFAMFLNLDSNQELESEDVRKVKNLVWQMILRLS